MMYLSDPHAVCAVKQIINSLPLVSQMVARCTFMNSVKAHMLASYKNCFLHIVKVSHVVYLARFY